MCLDARQLQDSLIIEAFCNCAGLIDLARGSAGVLILIQIYHVLLFDLI